MNVLHIKCYEHLLHFMQCGMMRLSKFDLQFVQNIQLIVIQNKPLTQNQVNLFKKLVFKYNRQFHKHGINDDILASLEWKCNIIPSEPAYTHAHISIQDGHIYLKSPFNKKFIKEFREYKNNTFLWHKEKRRYESLYSTSALKHVVDTTHKFYSDINYCPVVSELLNSMCDYADEDIWDPTLICKNGFHYLVAINENLYNAIKDIPLSNDFKTLDILSRYGIKIHDSIIKGNEKLEFASSYTVVKSIKDLESIVDYLKELGCDAAFFSGTGALTISLKRELDKLLHEENIAVINRPEFFVKQDDRKQYSNYKYAVMFQLGSTLLSHALLEKEIHKIICLKNPTPIYF
jgi:hypothetical protein